MRRSNVSLIVWAKSQDSVHKPPIFFEEKGEPTRYVSPCGLAVRRQAGEQKDLGSIRFGSPFSSEIVTLPTQLMKH